MNFCVDIKWHQLMAMTGMLLFAACTKPEPIYEVNPVVVNIQGGTKKALKSDRQFVSGAFADLLKKQMSSAELDETMVCYAAVSDKELMRDMVIRDLLRRSTHVPDAASMRADVTKFVRDAYTGFYKREPSDLERWTIEQQIVQDTTLSPAMVYYAFMSAEEYRYF